LQRGIDNGDVDVEFAKASKEFIATAGRVDMVRAFDDLHQPGHQWRIQPRQEIHTALAQLQRPEYGTNRTGRNS
jgi:hypothetical protein